MSIWDEWERKKEIKIRSLAIAQLVLATLTFISIQFAVGLAWYGCFYGDENILNSSIPFTISAAAYLFGLFIVSLEKGITLK